MTHAFFCTTCKAERIATKRFGPYEYVRKRGAVPGHWLTAWQVICPECQAAFVTLPPKAAAARAHARQLERCGQMTLSALL